MSPDRFSQLFGRVREIIESARATAARSVDTAQVVAYWLIGKEIVEEEQHGKRRAGYGQELLRSLSNDLTLLYGKGYSSANLCYFRQFFLEYPDLVRDCQIHHALRDKSSRPDIQEICRASRGESLDPGRLHPDLSWTHYRTLLRVQERQKRAFYEVESIGNSWTARELERQINSLLYERLAKSKDKAGLLKLALRGQEVQKPADVFKDPFVIEFLGSREPHGLAESDLEKALVDNLQRFLLELGKGFAFMSRQERITLDGDHFYIDLVFYHAVLQCYVLIDLKVGKLTHQDLGQIQFYVNYFDKERRSSKDGPTLGLILCTDKNDAVVRYTLGEGQEKIFASRYQLHLPTEAELGAELRRNLLDHQKGAGDA
ncbi:MAG: PDDEXK nuclease domain-containing protein [Elusimicrobiota bacterium]